MLSFSPYLHFMGNTEDAMTYYKSVLGGEFTKFTRYKDVPGGDKMLADEQEKIIHISLTVNSSMTIMATDFLVSMEQKLELGNNFQICLHTQSEAETEKIYNGLAAGGQIVMPLNKTFFAAYFGMCKDKFGIQWMVSYILV